MKGSTAPLEPGEQEIASTSFGMVTNRRIRYRYKKGWFSSGVEEDLPLRHVTSVRLETYRGPVRGAILVLVGLSLLVSKNGPLELIGAVLLALGVLYLWGSPKVVVNTAGNDRRPAKGFPWQRGEAGRFVDAVRGQLFKDEAAAHSD